MEAISLTDQRKKAHQMGMMNNTVLQSMFNEKVALDIVLNASITCQKRLYVASDGELKKEKLSRFLSSFFASDRKLRSYIHNALLGSSNEEGVVIAGNYLSSFPDIYGVLVLPIE